MRRLVIMALVLGCSSSRPGAGGVDGSVGSVDSATSGTLDSRTDGNSCATQPCDILTQCGCGSFESCDLNDTDTGTACRGTSGGKEGAGCAAATACAGLYTCVFFGDSGNCERYCAKDADCIAPRGLCAAQLLNSADQPIPGVLLCTSNCDPTAIGDPLCPAGLACGLMDESNRNVVECLLAGTATQGQACSDTVACAPGYTCTGPASGPSVCRRTCAPPANTGCPASTTCAAFTPPFVVGNTQYGICL